MIQEIATEDAYTVTRKVVQFPGFIIGLVTFSNAPDRYMVSFAEIGSRRWAQIAPFRVGASTGEVRRKLGAAAGKDRDLKARYGSEAGDVGFQVDRGRITRISYGCYTG